MTVSTFYPDANPESTSVDGMIEAQTGSDQTWTNIRATSTGNAANPSGAQLDVARAIGGATTNQYSNLTRGFFLFDTSSLPDGDSVSAATFELYVKATSNALGATSISIILCNPASDTNLVVGDFDQFTFIKQATDRAIAGLTNDQYEAWTLNSTGLGNISKTGITKFGTIVLYDMADSPEPTWASSGDTKLQVLLAEGSNDPKLVVTHASLFKPKVMMF